MTPTTTIEKLLQWAFREELPKGRPVSASPWDAISNYATLGTRVDTGGWRDGLGFVHGAPDADAETIGAAVAALPRDWRLGEDRVLALAGPYAGLDPLAARALSAAPFNLPALIIRCAVLAQPMEWDVGVPRHRPVTRPDNQWPLVFGFDDDGQLATVRADRRGRYDLSRAPRCHLEWVEPSPRQVIEARADYAAWHTALCLVRDAIAAELVARGAITVAASATPWATGMPAKPHVLRSSVRTSSARLPLAPRRPAPLPPLESDIERLARRRRPVKMKQADDAQA